MQDSSNKPDLNENLNVTTTHDPAVRDTAAVRREKLVNEGGREPISLWVFVSCAAVLLLAGLALGKAGNLFDYNSTVPEGYVFVAPDAGDGDGPPPVPALDLYVRKGQQIYGKCIGCHGPDGKGSASFPPLAGSEWALGDTEVFAMIVLNGLSGPASDGKQWGNMPAQGIGMSPTDLAAVMTFVRNSFGNSTGDVVTVEMATKAIEISEARANAGQPMSADQLQSVHSQALPGAKIEPDTMLNPVTMEPVDGEGGGSDAEAEEPAEGDEAPEPADAEAAE